MASKQTKSKKNETTKSKKATSKKKTTAKRVVLPKVLKPASEKHYFVLANGVRLSSILHLADELAHMPHEVFYHHVTSDRNDFATWINDVFEDKELAEVVSQIHDPNSLRLTLYRYLLMKAMKVCR